MNVNQNQIDLLRLSLFVAFSSSIKINITMTHFLKKTGPLVLLIWKDKF